MEYPSTDDIIYINGTQVGPGMVRDYGLLESAVIRPQQIVYGTEVYPDIQTKAAALTKALVQYHPFGDGNKLTRDAADRALPCGTVTGLGQPPWAGDRITR
ncbi:MAG TPA: Fic family protein [Propionibacteriaceae bacterium]|jgi:death-on-curing protein